MSIKDILQKGKSLTPRFKSGLKPRPTDLFAHTFPKKTEMRVKGLSYQAKSLVNEFTEKLNKQLSHHPLFEKANVMVKSEKQGSLYKAIVSLLPKSKKGIVITSEGRSIQELTSQITKKLRNLLSKKK